MQPKANEGFGPLAQGLAIGIAFVHGEAVLAVEEQSDLALFRDRLEHETVGSSATVIYPAAFAGRASASVVPTSQSAGFTDAGSAAQFDLQGKTPMPSSDELTDAKIAAAEAHTDTKIERLGRHIDVLATTIVGKIESLKNDVSKLEDDISKSDQYNRATKLAVISTIFGVGLASVISISILIVALFTYGDALFGRGMNVRDVVHAVITEQQEIQKRETTQPPSSPPNVKQK